jgi:beta-glucanase (GH16 family)
MPVSNMRKTRSKRLVFSGLICVCILLPVLWGYFQWQNTPPRLPGWTLVFDDEFNGTSLDTQKWNIEDSSTSGYQNCCLDYGVQRFTPQALSFFHGTLRITTQAQAMDGYLYTSGAITTENKFSFKYGRVDIRAKLPKTQGFWPALWMLPNHSKGIAPFEIDMMELLGKAPTIVHMTNHWGSREDAQIFTGPDFSQNYHVFSVVWTSTSIRWYIDGVQRFESKKGISNHNMYLIINSTLGGDWTGNPDKSTVLPQHMDIDYVRIYQPTTCFLCIMKPLIR